MDNRRKTGGGRGLMKAFRFRCKFCGESHQAKEKHFPIELKEKLPVYMGKAKNRRQTGELKHQTTGYACKKCWRKHRISQFIKEHNIKQLPGQRMIDAIRKKAQEVNDAKTKRIVLDGTKSLEQRTGLIGWLKDKIKGKR